MKGGFRRRRLEGGSIVLVAVACVAAAGCGRGIMAAVFDLPPEPQPSAPVETARIPVEAELALPDPDTITPEIEQFLSVDADTVKALLPRDHAGNIDWMEALRSGIIRPRAGIGGSRDPDPSTFRFAFDFYFPGPNELFDAYFPHSSHTAWVDCRQCHGRIFKYRDTEIKMADVLQGKYCGECHGKVAFPVMTGCERCHTSLDQPPDRATPELIGTIQLHRVGSEPDTAAVDTAAADTAAADTAGAAVRPEADTSRRRFITSALPPARFPHWVHRIRFRCKTCHVAIFEPKAGANRITMKDIDEGRACGMCHDGETAFRASFGTCQRCHVPGTPAVAP